MCPSRVETAGGGAVHRRATGVAGAVAWSTQPACLRDGTSAASTSAAASTTLVPSPRSRRPNRLGTVVRSLAAALASAGDVGRNVVVPPSAYQSLSLLFLLHENLKRAHGRCAQCRPFRSVVTRVPFLRSVVTRLSVARSHSEDLVNLNCNAGR